MKFLKNFIYLSCLGCIVNAQYGSNVEYVSFTKKRSRSCSIDMGNIRNDESIYLNTNLEFRIPVGQTIFLENGERILIDCGLGRTLRNQIFDNRQQIAAECYSGTIFYDGHPLQQQPDLDCTDGDYVRIQRTLTLCGGDGRIFRIGFNVINIVGEQTFAPVLAICFNEETKSIFFVKSHIYGTVARNLARGYSNPNINNGLFTTGQRVTADFFGVTNTRTTYTRFDRGHYAPNADFPFAPHRSATFFYFNMGPMKDNFNRVRWSALETLVRQISLGVTANILTGGFYYVPLSERSTNDPFTLPKTTTNPSLERRQGRINLLNNNNYNNGQRQVYGIPWELESIIIPNFFWKIVNIGFRGIAYVMPTENNLELPENCLQNCVLRNQGNRYYACRVDSFMDCINTIKGNFDWPAEFRTNQLLNNY